MRKTFLVLAIGAAMMAFNVSCDEEEDSSTQEQVVPQPYTHDALSYKVKVKYNVNFTYTPHDADDAPQYVINEFESRLEADGNNGNGYEMAEGETPNLVLNITMNSDNSDNKTMQVSGQVSDDTFSVGTDNSYQDPEKMIDAMADRVNDFVSQGWHGTR